MISGLFYSKRTLEQVIDICNLSSIYTDEFKYCVPESVVRTFFDGNSFGRKEPYTLHEQSKLRDDINDIYSRILKLKPIKEPTAVITAGSPGSGKTQVMLQYLRQEALQGRNFAYVDPDDVCLKRMERTWESEILKALEEIKDQPKEEQLAAEKKIREDAYIKWRPGSNAAAHIILANLIREKYAFYFGSTSSSPMTANTFKYLKELGYRIHLIHISAPDDVRWDSIKERDKTFVQTTQEDVFEKGKLVPQRIHDTFLMYADQIDFYFRPQAPKDGVLVASWKRMDLPHLQGELVVHNKKMYAEMVKVHNAICSKLQISDSLLWENSVEKASKIVQVEKD